MSHLKNYKIMSTIVEDIEKIYKHAKEVGLNPAEILVPESLEETAKEIADKNGISVTIKAVHPQFRYWDIEEYKKQVFKYDGNAKPITIADIWDTIPRRSRREITRMVNKGKNPDIRDYV